MALGDLQGRAKTSATNPEAKGMDDFSGFWHPLSKLKKVYQWAGSGLRDTGYLSADPDRPFEQYRTLILPPDPRPRDNPRIDPAVTAPWPLNTFAPPTTPDNQGFTQFVLESPALGDYPMTKIDVLAQVAALTGIPTPPGVVDRSVTTLQNRSVSVMAANPLRTWLLIYSPAVPPVAMALLDQAFWGGITNLPIGPGQCFFWADAQMLTATYKGALSIVGLIPGMNLFAFESD